MENTSKINHKAPLRCKLVYFAWLREQIGHSEETIEAPGHIATVADLVEYLRGQSGGHARALGNMQVVRVAVNRQHSGLDAAIADNDEIAFFPPVTGG